MGSWYQPPEILQLHDANWIIWFIILKTRNASYDYILYVFIIENYTTWLEKNSFFEWQKYCLLLGWDNASSAFNCRRRLEVENCHEGWSEEKDIYLFLFKRQAMLKDINFPPYYPILSVLFRFTSHFFIISNEDVSKFFCEKGVNFQAF